MIFLSKQRLQLMRCLAIVASAMLFISSCKKSTPVDIQEIKEPEPKVRYDSVYFEIEGRSFSGKPNLGGMNEIRNSGYRMRYLTAPKEGMTIYYEYGMTKQGWYAPTDSIYFTGANAYWIDDYKLFKIAFSQGFHKKNMTKSGSFYFPVDTRDLLRKGKLSFANDYESTNSKNGVAISFSDYGGTAKPEFAFEESIANYPQDDSLFEIINTEQIDKESYFLEAKFELNLYDKNRAKHRITNGYIRFTLKSRGIWGNFFY